MKRFWTTKVKMVAKDAALVVNVSESGWDALKEPSLQTSKDPGTKQMPEIAVGKMEAGSLARVKQGGLAVVTL